MQYRKPYINIRESLQQAQSDIDATIKYGVHDLDAAKEWLNSAENSYEPIRDLVKQGIVLPDDCKGWYADIDLKITSRRIQIANARDFAEKFASRKVRIKAGYENNLLASVGIVTSYDARDGDALTFRGVFWARNEKRYLADCTQYGDDIIFVDPLWLEVIMPVETRRTSV